MPWKAVEMVVEVDLGTEKGKNKQTEYQKVKLLFVRGINEEQDVEGSRKKWALFLCTDSSIGTSTMLEAYALRWSIEVYFKKAKQHLGFLKEQTITFVSHTASIHLCAIRYLILINAIFMGPDISVGEIRENIQDQFRFNVLCNSPVAHISCNSGWHSEITEQAAGLLGQHDHESA